MNKLFNTVSRPVAYLASAAAVAALLVILKPAAIFMSVVWPLAFWTLVGLDLFRSQKQDWANEEKNPTVDRILGYILAAPFIFPVRFYELLPARVR